MQDTKASENKLQMRVTIMDEISLRTTTHMNRFDSAQDTDASEDRCDKLQICVTMTERNVVM